MERGEGVVWLSNNTVTAKNIATAYISSTEVPRGRSLPRCATRGYYITTSNVYARGEGAVDGRAFS